MERSTSWSNNKNSLDRLPDEVLISIVSLLPAKEAGKTSVLARRWRYFWVFNPILDFDGSEMVRKVERRRKFLERGKISFKGRRNGGVYMTKRKMLQLDRTTFVGWVNRALSLHSSETIDEFRVVFDLDRSNANDIDGWIEFAFAKGVKRLELSMVRSYEHLFRCWQYREYTFPNICRPRERSRILPPGQSTCESLLSLRLTKVDVDGKVVEFFISNCPLLEELHVENADGFERLRSGRQANRLRRLAIVSCRRFRGLEICSPNLVSCTCTGAKRGFEMALKDVSCLVNLSLGETSLSEFSDYWLNISGCSSRLETLTLQLTTVFVILGEVEREIPNLPRLKKLAIDVHRRCRESVLCFTPLLNVAPSLREVVLKLLWPPRSIISRPQRPGPKHQCLKVFEIVLVGFAGVAVPLEVAHYVLENTSSLETMIINGKAVTGKNLDNLKAKAAREAFGQYIPDSLLVFK